MVAIWGGKVPAQLFVVPKSKAMVIEKAPNLLK